jgi:hypothetical protein
VRENTISNIGVVEPVQHQAELDLVVPFTTPELTRSAVEAADRMSAGLNAAIRLVKVQVVPFPMDLSQSPVYIDFLKEQLSQFKTELPAAGEIRLSREFEPGLEGTLTGDSLVILATKKRPWRTRTERLAASLRHSGHNVILIEAKNA